MQIRNTNLFSLSKSEKIRINGWIEIIYEAT